MMFKLFKKWINFGSIQLASSSRAPQVFKERWEWRNYVQVPIRESKTHRFSIDASIYDQFFKNIPGPLLIVCHNGHSHLKQRKVLQAHLEANMSFWNVLADQCSQLSFTFANEGILISATPLGNFDLDIIQAILKQQQVRGISVIECNEYLLTIKLEQTQTAKDISP